MQDALHRTAWKRLVFTPTSIWRPPEVVVGSRQGRLQRGFTAVELMVGVAVIAIISAVAVPGLGALFERIRLSGVANELAADVQLARSEAVRRRTTVTIEPMDDSRGYEIRAADVAIKAVAFPNGLTLTSGAAIDIDALRATSTVGALDLSNTAGTMRVSVGLMGRVTLCAASGSLPGYPAC